MKVGPNPVLEVCGVGKAYEDRFVLRGASFSIIPGEIAILLGPSGSGKSTLLRMILGEEVPSCGSLLVDGVEMRGPSARCGIVFQRYSLFPHLSVRDNLTLGVRFRTGVPDPDRRVQDMLTAIGLDGDAEKFPFELSGGMQQRVAVGQALIGKPRLLLMDEPFGALDPENRSKCQELLLRVASEEKMTVLFVTHDLSEAALVGTRLLVLRNLKSASGEGESIAHDYDFSNRVPLGLSGGQRSKEYEQRMVKILELTGYSFGTV